MIIKKNKKNMKLKNLLKVKDNLFQMINLYIFLEILKKMLKNILFYKK